MQNDVLISRAALIRAIKQHVPTPNTQELYEINLCIIDAPAVDAAPVVHAKAIAQSIFDKKARICIYTAQRICSNCAAYVADSWNCCPLCRAILDTDAPTYSAEKIEQEE